MHTRRFDLKTCPGRRRTRRLVGSLLQIVVNASALSATVIGFLAARDTALELILPITLTWFLVGNVAGQAIKGESPKAARRRRIKGGAINGGRMMRPGGIRMWIGSSIGSGG